jgi:hypothetical protein
MLSSPHIFSNMAATWSDMSDSLVTHICSSSYILSDMPVMPVMPVTQPMWCAAIAFISQTPGTNKEKRSRSILLDCLHAVCSIIGCNALELPICTSSFDAVRPDSLTSFQRYSRKSWWLHAVWFLLGVFNHRQHRRHQSDQNGPTGFPLRAGARRLRHQS